MVAAHLFHSEPFDLVDDRIELRLPGVEYAQVQAAIAAEEAGCVEAILGETEQVHDSRMAAAGDGDDALAGDVDIKNVLTLTCNIIEQSNIRSATPGSSR